MTWSQLKVTCKVPHLDTLCAIMSYIDSSIMIEDYSDIETGLKTVYGDLIDEELLEKAIPIPDDDDDIVILTEEELEEHIEKNGGINFEKL